MQNSFSKKCVLQKNRRLGVAKRRVSLSEPRRRRTWTSQFSYGDNRNNGFAYHRIYPLRFYTATPGGGALKRTMRVQCRANTRDGSMVPRRNDRQDCRSADPLTHNATSLLLCASFIGFYRWYLAFLESIILEFTRKMSCNMWICVRLNASSISTTEGEVYWDFSSKNRKKPTLFLLIEIYRGNYRTGVENNTCSKKKVIETFCRYIPIGIHHRAERAERNRCSSSSVECSSRYSKRGRFCVTFSRKRSMRHFGPSIGQTTGGKFFFFPPFPFFFFLLFFGISRSFASPRKCARVELEARVSWRARIGISSFRSLRRSTR